MTPCRAALVAAGPDHVALSFSLVPVCVLVLVEVDSRLTLARHTPRARPLFLPDRAAPTGRNVTDTPSNHWSHALHTTAGDLNKPHSGLLAHRSTTHARQQVRRIIACPLNPHGGLPGAPIKASAGWSSLSKA